MIIKAISRAAAAAVIHLIHSIIFKALSVGVMVISFPEGRL
jgi:hypothetical protein